MVMLTDKQIKQYNKNGFLLVKNLIPLSIIDEINDLCKKFNHITKDDWKIGKEMAYYETNKMNSEKRILMRVENLVDFYPLISNVAQSKEIFSTLEKIMGEKIILFKDKINFKNPGSGGFRPHQDPNKSWLKFSNKFCNALITISESAIDNGCIELAPEGHKLGLIPQDGTGLLPENTVKNLSFKMIPTSPGDVVFFDALSPHRSKSNNSKSQRINLYLTYNALMDGNHRHEYFEEKRAEFPPDNERVDKTKIQNSNVHEAIYTEN